MKLLDMKIMLPVVYLFMLFVNVLSAAEEPVRIGQRWELFVDDYLIEKTEGDIALHLNRPTAREVVLIHDEAWEGNTCGYHTIFQDGPVYRMYYRGWDHDGKTQKQLHKAVVCYAESKDGIKWEKPSLGLFEFNGSKDNNIILTEFGTHNFTPFKDSNPACPPDSLYKAVARGEDAGHQQLFAYRSPDGIRWKMTREAPIITEGAFDSQNLVFYDTLRKEYRAYFRDFRDGVRDIKTATSKDFLNWTKPAWLDYGGAPKEHLYTNQIQPYYRSPHIFVGFPTRYIPHRGSLTEGLFMTSRDGLNFHRWGEAVIRPGQNSDKWQNRSNYIWLGIVETQSDLPGAGKELSIYSNEAYYKGRGVKTRRYTYRIDGFVSLRASLRGGETTTKPLIFKGDTLAVNFSSSTAGSLKVEIQDETGQPIPGCTLADSPEIYGDEIEHPIKWKAGNLAKLAGKPIRIRFQLKDADLYAFGFKTTR